VAGTPAAAKIVGASGNEFAGAALALRFDDRISMDSGGHNCMAGLGTRADVRGSGTRSSRSRQNIHCGHCRRRNFGRPTMAQFATNGRLFGEGAGVYPGTCRAYLPAITGGAGLFFGVSGDSRIVRGVLVPGFLYGCLDKSGAARLERGTLLIFALWAGAPLPRARWACEHIDYRHGVRNGANRVRWHDSGYSLAFCCGCGRRTGRTEVSPQLQKVDS